MKTNPLTDKSRILLRMGYYLLFLPLPSGVSNLSQFPCILMFKWVGLVALSKCGNVTCCPLGAFATEKNLGTNDKGKEFILPISGLITHCDTT